MAITKDRKTEIIDQYRREPTDTGSPEVQIALLTARINELTRAHAHAQEGPRQPARPAEDGQQAVRLVDLSAQQGPQPLSGGHRSVGPAQVDPCVSRPVARCRSALANPLITASTGSLLPRHAACRCKEECSVQASRVERPLRRTNTDPGNRQTGQAGPRRRRRPATATP